MRAHSLIAALLAATSSASGLGKPTTRCYTALGSHPPPHGCPTWHRTSHTPCTTTHTTTRTKTSSASSTVTVFTSVTTILSTALVVPAPSGFIPIQSSLPDSTYDGAAGDSPVKRDVLGHSPARRAPALALEDRQYATAVTCWTWTHSSTCVAAHRTSAAVKVISSKELPTTTVTRTTTETSYTTTVYNACATNNFADQYKAHGQPKCYLNLVQPPASPVMGEDLSLANFTSAYQCCEFAFTDPHGPTLWAYYPPGTLNIASSPNSAGCVVVTEGELATTCPSQSNNTYTLQCETTSKANEIIFGNGQCGQATSVAVPQATTTA